MCTTEKGRCARNSGSDLLDKCSIRSDAESINVAEGNGGTFGLTPDWATSLVFASIEIFKALPKTSALVPAHHDPAFDFKDERVHAYLIAFDAGGNPV